MLRNHSTPKWLVIANIGLIVLLIGISFHHSVMLVTAPLLTFPISGATLLYLIWLRWQIIIPPRDIEGNVVKRGLPISKCASIWMSIITLMAWALFSPLSIALSNLNKATEYISDSDMTYHLCCGAAAICVMILLLLIVLIVNVIIIAIRNSDVTRWRRLLAMSIEVICTIIVYFMIYVVGFILTY
ncbi:MAG: hypothetical protein SNJ29_13760 [Rikenellaceae bacterium]